MTNTIVSKAPGVFWTTCAVRLNIHASAERIWNLLTDAAGFPRWNSTVTGIDGRIGAGERIRIHVPGTARTFTPTVSGVIPGERMTWTGGFFRCSKGCAPSN